MTCCTRSAKCPRHVCPAETGVAPCRSSDASLAAQDFENQYELLGDAATFAEQLDDKDQVRGGRPRTGRQMPAKLHRDASPAPLLISAGESVARNAGEAAGRAGCVAVEDSGAGEPPQKVGPVCVLPSRTAGAEAAHLAPLAEQLPVHRGHDRFRGARPAARVRRRALLESDSSLFCASHRPSCSRRNRCPPSQTGSSACARLTESCGCVSRSASRCASRERAGWCSHILMRPCRTCTTPGSPCRMRRTRSCGWTRRSRAWRRMRSAPSP